MRALASRLAAAALAGLLLLPWAAALDAAESWAAVGLQIREGRRPAPGIELRLRPEGIAAADPAMEASGVTDEQGRAVVYVQPGVWRLELLRGGEVAYFVSLRVAPGRRAEELGSPARDIDAPDLRWRYFEVDEPPPVALRAPRLPAPVRPAEPPPREEPSRSAPPAAAPPAAPSETPADRPAAPAQLQPADPSPSDSSPFDTIPPEPGPYDPPAAQPEPSEPPPTEPEPTEAEPTEAPSATPPSAPEPPAAPATPAAPPAEGASPAERTPPPPPPTTPEETPVERQPPPVEPPAEAPVVREPIPAPSDSPPAAAPVERQPPPAEVPAPPAPVERPAPADEEEPPVVTPAPQAPVERQPVPAPSEPPPELPPTEPPPTAEPPAERQPPPLPPAEAPSAERLPPPLPPAAAPPEQPPTPAPDQPLPTPAPPPAAEPELPPAPPRFAASAAGECLDCREDEAAAVVERTVAPRGGPCGAEIAPAALDAARRLAGRATGPQPLEGGGLGASTGGAGCQVLGVVLPAGATYRGYRYEVEGGGDAAGRCYAGDECPVPGAAWPERPTIRPLDDGSTLVYGLFRNTSPDRARRARLTVYYRP